METRKQIIELIEPYMDKTLSEGCLIKWYFIYDKVNDNWSWDIFGLYHNMNVDEICLRHWCDNDFKILWHYDITAVLKYIDNSYRDKRWIPHWDILVELTPWDIHINIWEELYMVPNKPLHLYTEEEDKNLLELLKKIWQTNK